MSREGVEGHGVWWVCLNPGSIFNEALLCCVSLMPLLGNLVLFLGSHSPKGCEDKQLVLLGEWKQFVVKVKVPK